MDYDHYQVRREFETWVAGYKVRMNGQAEEFLSYVLNLHERRKLLGANYAQGEVSIGNAVSSHIKMRAFEEDPAYPSPYAYMNHLFGDFPNAEELKKRFNVRREKERTPIEKATRALKQSLKPLRSSSSA